MKKYISIGVVCIVLLSGIFLFCLEAYEVHTIKVSLTDEYKVGTTTLPSVINMVRDDQQYTIVGAQAAVNTWNYVIEANQAAQKNTDTPVPSSPNDK